MTECASDRSNRAGGTDAPLRLRDWTAVLLPALTLFALTANRGIQWADPGRHIWRVVKGEVAHPLGLALIHPLHHWLGRLAVSLDLVEPCLAVTLISSLAGAVAIANLYGCVVSLTRNRWAALLAAGSLMIAHTFWQLATRAETYTLTAALLSGECWCLVVYAQTRKRAFLYWIFLLNGFGLANHMLAALTTPVIGIVVAHGLLRKTVSLKDALIAAGLWLVGSLPYTCLVVAELARTGDVSGTLRSAFFGRTFADEVLNTHLSARMLLIGAGFAALSFPNLMLPAVGWGVVQARRFGIPVLARRALGAALILHGVFVMRFDVIDHYTFFLPLYVLLSIFGGIGFAVMLRGPRTLARRIGLTAAGITLASTPIWYALMPGVARRFDVLRGVARNKPYRDDYVYLFTPWSVVERSADRMSREAVALAGDDGIILVEDAMGEFAIRYQAARAGSGGLRITRELSPARIRNAVRDRIKVVLVPRDADAPKTVAPAGSWKRTGDLYVLSAGPSPPRP